MMKRSKEEWCTVLGQAPLQGSIPEMMYAQGEQIVSCLRQKNWLRSGDCVLDIGCGSGKVAIHCLEDGIQYVGIDATPAFIDYCRHSFSPYPQCTFIHLDCHNSLYHPEGTITPEHSTLPIEDASQDVVILNSVFTHLERRSACERYLAEISRVLRPDGILFSTWFRSPPNSLSGSADRTVFLETEIRDMLAGFDWVSDWSGTTSSWHDQWNIVLRRPVLR